MQNPHACFYHPSFAEIVDAIAFAGERMRWLFLLLLPLALCDKEREVDGAAARVHKHDHGAGDDHEADHQAILGMFVTTRFLR